MESGELPNRGVSKSNVLRPQKALREIGDARQQIEELTSGAPDETSAATRGPAETLPPPELPARSRALPWATLAVVAIIGLTLTSPLLWTHWRAGSATTLAALALTPLSFEQGGQMGAVCRPTERPWPSPRDRATPIRMRSTCATSPRLRRPR